MTDYFASELGDSSLMGHSVMDQVIGISGSEIDTETHKGSLSLMQWPHFLT